MPEPGVPHIERTHFEPQSAPAEVTLYFCPACGRRVSGDYNVDPARKSCTKTWHLTMVEPQKYRAVDG
jgi:hypothetical protein